MAAVAVAGAGAELVHIALQVVPPPIRALVPPAAPFATLLAPVAAPLLAVFETGAALLRLVEHFSRVERRARRRCVFPAGVRTRHHQNRADVYQSPEAAREN